jgi:hypothetical protein
MSQIISTLGEAMSFMATFAGGQVPSESDDEYAQWIKWIGVKQEEYALRGFWRRLLVSTDITIDPDGTVLPDNFQKANGIYVLEVDGEDWAEPTTSPKIFVNMEIDSTSANYGKWIIHLLDEEPEDTSATMWYFATPTAPSKTTDLLILPGDMIAYGALSEYFRQTGAEGSQDDARIEAENRLQEYLSLEVIPPRYELITHSTVNTNRLEIAKDYYRSRTDRNIQL